jgi:hypothetical protein
MSMFPHAGVLLADHSIASRLLRYELWVAQLLDGEYPRMAMTGSWWRPPKQPGLLPEVLAELELNGADAVRAVLAGSSDGVSGTSRDTLLRIGNETIKRGEMQDWLKWNDEVAGYWVKTGVIAAVIAAVFAFLGVVVTLVLAVVQR